MNKICHAGWTLSKTFNNNPSAENKRNKDEAIARTNNLRSSLQRSYFQDAVNSNAGNMKKMWQEVKRFWPYLNKSTVRPQKRTDTANSLETANIFNKFFSNVGKQLQESIPIVHEPIMTNNRLAPVFEFTPVSVECVSEVMKDLSPSKSCGVDGLTSRLLKSAGPAIIGPITHIINRSISTRTFPDQWKMACITPLHKSGDPGNPSNFRPISILPCLGKVLEKITHMQIYQYLTEYSILASEQSGFRKGYSTGTCLVTLLDFIFNNIDNGSPCAVLYLDLSKAFDTVDHDILCTKLRHYGFKMSAVSWVESYLCNRSQQTKVDNVLSDTVTVTCGVSQGSILGPLLFTLYVNDLPSIIDNGRCYLYADDTAIAVSDHRPEVLQRKLNQSLNLLASWFVKNKLSLNLKKCKYMIFGTSHQINVIGNLDILYSGVYIEKVNSFKYLGVVLDSRLTFGEHISYLKSKTYSKIKLLGRVRHILDQNTALTLYKTLILPVYDYCDFIYYSINSSEKEVLQKLQNCAFWTILRPDRLASMDMTHTVLHMNTLDDRRNKHVAIQMYKFVNHLAPAYCSNMFTPVSDIHSVNTRNAQKGMLTIPRMNLTMGQRNIRYYGVKVWHSVPTEVQNEDSLDKFKKAIYEMK